MKRYESNSKSIYQEIVELLVIFTRAVRRAQRENRKLGLPNVYSLDGNIYYQLPDGRITTRLPKSIFRKLVIGDGPYK